MSRLLPFLLLLTGCTHARTYPITWPQNHYLSSGAHYFSPADELKRRMIVLAFLNRTLREPNR